MKDNVFRINCKSKNGMLRYSYDDTLHHNIPAGTQEINDAIRILSAVQINMVSKVTLTMTDDSMIEVERI